MQVKFLNQGAEHIITIGAYMVPIHVERGQAKKIVNAGAIVEFIHITPGGKSFDWSTVIWLDVSEFRNANGTPKTKSEVAEALRLKVLVLRTVKLTEWDAMDSAVREDLA